MLRYWRLQFHFWRLGVREGLFGARAPDARPVPPPRLRHRVHGSTDIRGYLAVGRSSWESLVALLRAVGREPGEFRSVLDFGCGSGRVIRHVPRGEDFPRQICGVDIDAQAIRWCAQHLAGPDFRAISPRPPAPFPDHAFDFIFAISVFTHLDEAMQFAWLDELRRLLRPGGIFIASLHGEFHRSLSKKSYALERGFDFATCDKGLLKRDGLPRFYQDAQHTRTYVEREWSRHFRVLLYRERGIADHHDAVVLTAP